MINQRISTREFARLIGKSQQTVITWCGNGRIIGATPRPWSIPKSEVARIDAEIRNAELIEDRRNVIRDHVAHERDELTTVAAAAARQVGEKIAELSREQLADRAQLRALVAPLSLAVRAIEDLAVLDSQLDELSRKTRDDEWTPPEDFSALIEQENALVAARPAEKSPLRVSQKPAKRKPAK
jgi:hypothetical protein